MKSDFGKLAKQILNAEAEALLRVSLDHTTLEPIITCLAHAPLVVIMGVGKSAHIGRKIAATLTSTGTKAIFLHPTESLHGDMGIVGPRDVILAISYGGESMELLEALGSLKPKTLIAMTKDNNNSLSKLATYLIPLKLTQEAISFGVPSTSTTLSLALGDVLAACLMEVKNFSREDFAKLHPGGLLGKKLRLRVRDILLTKNLPLVDQEACLHAALVEANDKCLGNALLVDDQQRLIGILSDGDIRRALLQSEFDSTAPAKNFATLNPKTISNLDMLVVEALELIETYKISLLVVCDNQKKVLGVLHLHTLLALGLGNN
ncbi:Polysialic acid capsule expression protein KpsF [Helicobacter suis]|uniref:Polysialic acid capsule expression protein KpsF n=1 Tax=Helicobacter suis TaxID=104628 RepID=A0A6J4CYU7_9HELI|nr:KpsF/GutQ family sugar-phosphate isomerase [Helicobacter suis]BCD48180.1 Polysialic acid capsule expression protein KpsF [Helicobacter suis]BCD69902.1 Polysialic acid capsule expression protein KpsF [Helicobacter suis]